MGTRIYRVCKYCGFELNDMRHRRGHWFRRPEWPIGTLDGTEEEVNAILDAGESTE